MTKLNSEGLNSVSPGEWSIAHKKAMEDNTRGTETATATQVGGDWYKNCAIQPIEFIMKNDLGFCEGNAIKYICRHEQKGGALDIDKAIHYLEMLKEDLYS